MEDVLQHAERWVRKIMTREIWSDHPDNENGHSPLHDFSRGMKGVPDGVPAAYAQACIAAEKRHQMKETTVTTAGVQISLSESGDLTIIQSGSHYVVIAARDVQDFLSGLDSLVPDTDVPTDANQPVRVPGMASALPPTNAQLSMRQNELALKMLKKR